MEFIGQKVSHNKFGEGIIVCCGEKPQNDSTYIKVEFENKTIELVFPNCFEKHLIALDPKFAKAVERELSSISKKENVVEFSKPLAYARHFPQKHKPLTFCSINSFVFKKEIGYNTSKHKKGFLAFDKSGRSVGVVFMNDDKRKQSYGQAEICFFDGYIKEFGQWRLISINKERLSFQRLSKILDQQGDYEVTIDPRKGS